ncbi:MAG: spore germination protein GerW family protein [Thermomicrobiaceae bacterium]
MLNANRAECVPNESIPYLEGVMVNVEEVLAQARDSMTVKRVFGEPIEKDGLTIIPVARISGGGGGGGGQDDEGSGGSGVGYGLQSQPLGVYVIKDGKLSWQPSIDVNKIIMGGQFLVAVGLIVLGAVLKAKAGK